MARCLVALGSNLGDRVRILTQTCSALAHLPDCQLLARSSWHGTLPIGGADGQGEFLNGAALIETRLSAAQLAELLQATETKLGRQRVVRWDARTIDIDILLYDSLIDDSMELTIPHPRMSFRRFVLEPAAEIAGGMLHPTSGWTIGGLLAQIRNAPRYVIVTANRDDHAHWLADQLCKTFGCRKIADEGKNLVGNNVSRRDTGIQFPDSTCGQPPMIAVQSTAELEELPSTHSCLQSGVRPAVTIWLDATNPDAFAQQIELTGIDSENTSSGWTRYDQPKAFGLGPLARIRTDNPETAAQEAEAALRSIWPDLH